MQQSYENAVREANGAILSMGNGKVVYHISREDGEYWGESGCGGRMVDNCTHTLHKMVRTAPPLGHTYHYG